ncbi:MAG: N-6 DNA methylase, partial [Candidatus Cloacimonetes bacterium]|nr:N-6 DNA methylase [Candidatus Cloacimonadota bacterium]
MIKSYLKNITKKYLQGDAREESYYELLNELLYNFAEENNYDIDITTLPKKTEAGNPDFRIWDGVAHITGYIEAKKPEVENLDSIQVSEQLERYITTFPNVILTNFHEFRLYRHGELIERVSIARFFTLKELKKVPSAEKQTEFYNLLNKFFSFKIPRLNSASALAKELAKRTRFLRDEVIKIELEEEKQESRKPLTGFYHAFQKYLIYSLTKPQFADLYSQTITYGLFAARTRAGDDFNRELAYKYIPNTIGILRDIFKFISLEEPPLSLRVLVDDIAEILKVTHVKTILEKYYEQGRGKDPIIHFYETFLSEYDPKIREKRGVYYTPEPVVNYIVESLHEILKENFDLRDGFASQDVTVLDPAAGTLTFLAEAIKTSVNEYADKYGNATISNFIKNNILKNFYAF